MYRPIGITILIAFLSIFLHSCSTSPSPSENVYENTTRSGAVYLDEVWKGTIYITGDVTIYSGTVTIEANTTIKFTAGKDDQQGGSTTPISDPYFPSDPAIAHSQISSINVHGGTLYGVGTSAAPIIFTSDASSPEAGGWDCLQYNVSGSKLILQNTIIEYGYFGVQINAAADASQITFKDNTARHLTTAGIVCGNPFTFPAVTLTISGSDFSYCGHEGIATYKNVAATIENNVFHDILNKTDGGGAGVVIENNSSTIKNNQFLRNYFGINIITSDSNPVISGNSFSNNQTDINRP